MIYTTVENEVLIRAANATVALRDPEGLGDEMTFRRDAGGDPIKFARVGKP
jgi:hypothetical protein